MDLFAGLGFDQSNLVLNKQTKSRMKAGYYQLFWEVWPRKFEMTFQTAIRESLIETGYPYEKNLGSGKRE